MEIPENRATRFLTKPVVLITVGAVLLALIVWDIFLAVDDIGGNTWSELLRDAGKLTPVVPWLGGLVVGHLFHPGKNADPLIDAPGNALVLLGLTLLFVIIGFFMTVPTWVPVPLGAVAGAFLWPVATGYKDLGAILSEAAD